MRTWIRKRAIQITKSKENESNHYEKTTNHDQKSSKVEEEEEELEWIMISVKETREEREWKNNEARIKEKII